jgi:RND family efflux transporter MFP subunit
MRTGPATGCAVALALLASSGAQAATFDCVIEPHQTVDLRSPVDGLIAKVLVRRGDRIRAGQPLVVLESSVESSALEVARLRAQMDGRIAAARSRLDQAQRKRDRAAELAAQNFVAAQARDDAEDEVRIAQAELREATDAQLLARRELQYSSDVLARRTLSSPFNGVVVERMLNPGDLAEAGTGRRPVLKLAQVEPLRMEVVLPISAYGKLRPGSTATVTPETLGGRYAATVTVVDSVFDSASGTFGARLELPNAQGRLPAGIRCQVEFAPMGPPTPVAMPIGASAAPRPRR